MACHSIIGVRHGMAWKEYRIACHGRGKVLHGMVGISNCMSW